MKEIILSADRDSIVYSVPDDVAEHLQEYCLKFCDDWLRNSPDAKKYRKNGILCYDENDFIDYLNKYVFPEQRSVMLKNLGWTDLGRNLPQEYRDHPYFNF